MSLWKEFCFVRKMCSIFDLHLLCPQFAVSFARFFFFYCFKTGRNGPYSSCRPVEEKFRESVLCLIIQLLTTHIYMSHMAPLCTQHLPCSYMILAPLGPLPLFHSVDALCVHWWFTCPVLLSPFPGCSPPTADGKTLVLT